jgi:hypothetical protein
MTLHVAIEKILLQTGRSMTTVEIANALNKNKWYQKKDTSAIDSFQIHGRAKNYSHLFNLMGSTISLVRFSLTKQLPSKMNLARHSETPILKVRNIKLIDKSLLDKALMNKKNFKSAAVIDNIVPHTPGLYCIRITDGNKLPAPFNKLLADRNHNIIYIGIASKSLKTRFLNQELRANGHGTFFRSIGAMLGYRPAKGSLKDKTNKRNYRFLPSDEIRIIEWINKYLTINWVEINEDLEAIETALLDKYRPLLNLAKNPSAITQLTKIRAECVKIACDI